MFYNPPIHFAIGFVVLVIGLGLALDAPTIAGEATHLSGLPALSVAQLGATPLDQEVLVEGQVSPTTRPIYRDFVAYVWEEYRSSWVDDNDHWFESERVTPPFALRLPDGELPIVNDDYDFPMVEDAVSEAEPTGIHGAVRSRGLRPGAPVFAVGTVVTGPGGHRLHANTIYPGTRAEVVAHLQRWSRNQLYGGLGAIVIGLAEVGLAGWQLRRWLREVKEPAPPQPRQRGRRV